MGYKNVTTLEVARLARGAGFPLTYKGRPLLATITAISRAENSSGDADIIVKEPDGSHSVGLWQINSVHGYPDKEMQDPAANAEVAFILATNQDGTFSFDDWTMYKNGRYAAFLPYASIAAAIAEKENQTFKKLGPGRFGPGDPATPRGKDPDPYGPDISDEALDPTGLGGLLDKITSPFEAFVTFLRILFDPRTWLRALFVILGGILLLGVAFILYKELRK